MPSLRPTIMIHGIRTHARWQKEFGDALSVHGQEHRAYDYGRFSLLDFASASARQREVDSFYTWYVQQRQRAVRNPSRNRDFRPSAVAHSFGTYALGRALEKYPDLTVGRVILCGSILPPDFDWPLLFSRNQVLEVQNDYGAKDFWSRISRWLVSDSGPSGATGFAIDSPLVHQRPFTHFTHSDYFKEGHYDQWLETIRSPLIQFRTIRSSELGNTEEWEAIAVQTREIDTAVYAKEKGYREVRLPAGLSTTWLRANPDIYSILIDQKRRVHGYLNAMPVTTSAFEDLMMGLRSDHEVTESDIVTYGPGTSVDLYFMSVAIHPDSRRLGNGPEQSGYYRLLYCLTQHLERLARERRVFIRRIGAVGWSPEGVRLCGLLGMSKYRRDRFGHPTFVLDLSNSVDAEHPTLRHLLRTYTLLRGQSR